MKNTFNFRKFAAVIFFAVMVAAVIGGAGYLFCFRIYLFACLLVLLGIVNALAFFGVIKFPTWKTLEE